MRAKPKKLWAAIINLSGLSDVVPVEVFFSKDDEEKGTYWDKEGDFSVLENGWHSQYGCISFASTDKKIVQAWIDGVRSAMGMMKDWADSGFSLRDTTP